MAGNASEAELQILLQHLGKMDAFNTKIIAETNELEFHQLEKKYLFNK